MAPSTQRSVFPWCEQARRARTLEHPRLSPRAGNGPRARLLDFFDEGSTPKLREEERWRFSIERDGGSLSKLRRP